MSGWAAFAQAAAEAGKMWMESSMQHKANRTNIQLQREQQRWEEHMSGTAVQRRAADIQLAGGNRALAFTEGQAASTPSISAAQVQSEAPSGELNIMGAILNAANLRNVNADSSNKEAEARVKNVDAGIKEKLAEKELDFKANKLLEETEQQDLKTQIMRNLGASSAADRERKERTVDSLVATAAQQARAGKLDLDALENIAKVGGIEAGKMKDILRIIIELLKD